MKFEHDQPEMIEENDFDLKVKPDFPSGEAL